MFLRRSLWALSALGCLTCCTWLAAADWGRFRGPNGTGIAADTSLPVEFGEESGLAWKVPVDAGNSSPVVFGGRIYFQTANADGSERRLRCLALANGKELWVRQVSGKQAKVHPKSSLASGSAAVDAQRVVMLFWDGETLSVHAYSPDGDPLWTRPLGQFSSQHGAGHSPVLVENRVLVANDQDGVAEVVALDAKTGEVLWKTPRTANRANYSTPTLVERPGQPPELLVVSTAGTATYDLASGSETWKWNWKSNTKQLRTVASPLVTQGLVIFSGGNGPGDRQVAAVRLDGQGDVTETHLAWETHKLFPYVPSMLARGEHLYFVNDAGIAGCFLAKTGEQVWSHRLGEATVYASPLMAGGRIYAPAENGKVFVLNASPEYELLATNQLDDSIIASPATADGLLLIRGKTHLYAFGKYQPPAR
jgi:outer membrane protein assembly factor BamB